MVTKKHAVPRDPKLDLSKISSRVDSVNVSGLLRTHNDYVMKTAENLFKTNNFQALMIESMRAKSYLHELGIFKDISVHIDISRGENASPNGYEVKFKGKEMSRILGSVGTEVGQNEGSLRTELTVPNLFGRGESISIQGSYSSKRANDVQLKFWKPYFHTRFMDNRPEISFSLFHHTDRVDVSNFKNTSFGCLAEFAVNTLKPLELSHSLQYEASVREIFLLTKNAPMAIRQHCGPKLASLLRYSVIFDQRDNTVFPTHGLMIKSINEYCGLGGNVAYVSNNTHAEVSLPLFGGLVAQVCGRVGIIKETKKTTMLPINNLFYCGGPITLRGFKYGGTGPFVDGSSIGAQTYWSTGFHLWAPLPFSKVFKGLADNFRTHLFYNLGNINTFSTENMRSAAGIGLAFKLAERARIELNYCVPVSKCNSDKVVNGFQFGIGYEFV